MECTKENDSWCEYFCQIKNRNCIVCCSSLEARHNVIHFNFHECRVFQSAGNCFCQVCFSQKKRDIIIEDLKQYIPTSLPFNRRGSIFEKYLILHWLQFLPSFDSPACFACLKLFLDSNTKIYRIIQSINVSDIFSDPF